MSVNTITKQRCIIVGLGQTGLSCARFLANQDMDLVVMDTRQTPPALEVLQHELPQVVVKTGGLDIDWLNKADLIVLSPGVDPRLPALEQVKQAGKEIIGDIELFARYANAPIVAITGSNGKSTVTTLLGVMANIAGKNVKVGGNLGVPALDLLVDPAPDFYILELSSFQLETVKSLNAFASTILNLSPDHLDRYDSLEAYHQAKKNIFNGDGVMVVNLDDPLVAALRAPNRNTIGFSLNSIQGMDFGVLIENGEAFLAEGKYPLMPINRVSLSGTHNVANILAALALGSAMALPMTAMISAIEVFKGLPHRCVLVKQVQGVNWFNDSKATNVGSTIAAINGLADQGKIVLIAGGQGKGQAFEELTLSLQKSVKAVVLMGEASADIAAVIPASIPWVNVQTMQEAVEQASSLSAEGDLVLLSPACASFDMFKGYQDRGEQFESAVRRLNDD